MKYEVRRLLLMFFRKVYRVTDRKDNHINELCAEQSPDGGKLCMNYVVLSRYLTENLRSGLPLDSAYD